MQTLCGRSDVHIESQYPATHLIAMETVLTLMAASAGLVFYALHKRDYWLMAATAFITAGVSVHAFFASAWPVGAIETAWVLLLARRASSAARSQS